MGLDNWIVTESLFFYVIVRFVRFVSNPEVLERVYSLETEIIQIKEAIGIQNNSEMALTVVSKLGFLSNLFGVWSVESNVRLYKQVEGDLRAKRSESTEGILSL